MSVAIGQISITSTYCFEKIECIDVASY